MSLLYEKEDYVKIVKNGPGVLRLLEASEEQPALTGEICSILGNAYLELDQPDLALQYLLRDLELSKVSESSCTLYRGVLFLYQRALVRYTGVFYSSIRELLYVIPGCFIPLSESSCTSYLPLSDFL